MDAGVKRELEAKVYAGERLTRADGEALYACDDLAWLGRLAHHRRTGLHGDRVLFAVSDADDGAGRATMRYGHGDEHAQRVDEVLRLRALQDEKGEFLFFAPLPTESTAADRPVAPAESLKTFAVSRLLFDNVPHVRATWGAHDRSVAQLALNFGADDLAGPSGVVEREDVLDLIGDAGFRPVERDARYQVVHEFDAPPSLADRRSEPQQVWA